MRLCDSEAADGLDHKSSFLSHGIHYIAWRYGCWPYLTSAIQTDRITGYMSTACRAVAFIYTVVRKKTCQPAFDCNSVRGRPISTILFHCRDGTWMLKIRRKFSCEFNGVLCTAQTVTAFAVWQMRVPDSWGRVQPTDFGPFLFQNRMMRVNEVVLTPNPNTMPVYRTGMSIDIAGLCKSSDSFGGDTRTVSWEQLTSLS